MPENDAPRPSGGLEVAFPVFDQTTPVYANHLSVQFVGDAFVISFYAAFPPVLLSMSPEERERELASLGKVPPKCVAKVAIGAERMPILVAVLMEHVSQTLKLGARDGDSAERPDGEPPEDESNG